MADSDKKRLAISASRDLIFSILALVIYNGVLQLLIYPGLNAGMGAEAFGTVLYLISVISIMGAGFGTAASYSRMVAKKDRNQANGDYNVFLLIVAGISLVVTAIALAAPNLMEAGASGTSTLNSTSFSTAFLPFFVLMVLTVVRYYADVEYRMTIRFVDYCVFFTFVSLGYVIGLFAGFRWWLVLMVGEAFGIIYTVIRGSILRPPFMALSDSFRENLKSCFTISASNILSALILNSDRLLLRLMTGGREVTVFYTASLMGKIVAMLTTPLNGVIISYFTNYRIGLSKKRFLFVSAGLLAVSVIGAVLCSLLSVLFVRLMYPEVYDEARSLFFLANLGQILYFISGSLMVIILSFTKERIQLYINMIYVLGFVLIAIPGTYFGGIKGLALGLVFTNMIRFMTTSVLGFRRIKEEV